MKLFAVCCLLLVAGSYGKGDWSSATSTTSPVAKVIELLGSLKGKIAADVEKETGLMEEFTSFCDDQLKDIDYAINTAKGQVQDFHAGIEDSEATMSSLAAAITDGSSKIAAKESELADATNVRDAQRKDFQDNEHELRLSIDELGRAVVAAKKEMSFVQVKGGAKRMSVPSLKKLETALSTIIEATNLPAQGRATLKSFVQEAQQAAQKTEDGDDLKLGGKAAEAPTSGGIVETLTDMEEKAQGQLSDLRKAEMQTQYSFEMVKTGIVDEIKLQKDMLSKDAAEKSQSAETLGKMKGELGYTSKTMEADKARLAGQTQECTSKTAEWAERQKSASDEMATIDKAKEILTSGTKSLLQVGTASRSRARMSMRKAFGSDDEDDDEDKEERMRDKLAAAFKGLSKKFNSFALAQMVSSARADPFGKIRGLIEDMIEKLVTEANEEASQKAFCDEENAKARKSRDEKSMTIDKLSARVDEAASKTEVLKKAVAELEAEIAEIDKASAEATNIRGEEHTEFLKSSKDFKDSAEAVATAISVLKSYYEGSFLQLSANTNKGKKQPMALGTSEGPEFGGSGREGGDSAHTIINVLEVAEEDFTKLLAETEAEEEATAAEFKKVSDESRIAKAAKSQEVKDKESEMKSLDVALSHHTEDKQSVQKELDAVMDYLDKLKPQCESKAMSFAEKKARREAEIEGLKDALGVIEGTTIGLSQKKTNLRHVRRN